MMGIERNCRHYVWLLNPITERLVLTGICLILLIKGIGSCPMEAPESILGHLDGDAGVLVTTTIPTQTSAYSYSVSVTKEDKVSELLTVTVDTAATSGIDLNDLLVSPITSLDCQAVYAKIEIIDNAQACASASIYSDPITIFDCVDSSNNVITEMNVDAGNSEGIIVTSNVKKSLLCATIGATTCTVHAEGTIDSPYSLCYENFSPLTTDSWKLWGLYKDDQSSDICKYEMAATSDTDPVVLETAAAALPDNTHIDPSGVNLDRDVTFKIKVVDDNDDSNYFSYDHRNFNPKVKLRYGRSVYEKVCVIEGDPHVYMFDNQVYTIDAEDVDDNVVIKMFHHDPGIAPSTLVSVVISKVSTTSKRMAVLAVTVQYGDQFLYTDRIGANSGANIGDLFHHLFTDTSSTSWISVFYHTLHNRVMFVRLPNGIDLKFVANHVKDIKGDERFLNVNIYVPDHSEFMGTISGLCGNNDGDPGNDATDVTQFIIDEMTYTPCTSADVVECSVCQTYYHSGPSTITDPPSITGIDTYCPCEAGGNSDATLCLDGNTQDNFCVNSPHPRLKRIDLVKETLTCPATLITLSGFTKETGIYKVKDSDIQWVQTGASSTTPVNLAGFAGSASDLWVVHSFTWRYSVASDMWELLPNPAEARSFGAPTFILNNRLYVAGGYDLSSMESIPLDDPVQGWRTESVNLPFICYNSRPVVIDDTVYIAGCLDSFRDGLMSWRADQSTWTTLTASNVVRSAYCVVTDSVDKIYVIGGNSGTGFKLATVTEYSITGDSWVTLASLPEPLNESGCEFHNEHIFVMGGDGDSGESDKIYVYDVAQDTWALSATRLQARIKYPHTGLFP